MGEKLLISCAFQLPCPCSPSHLAGVSSNLWGACGSPHPSPHITSLSKVVVFVDLCFSQDFNLYGNDKSQRKESEVQVQVPILPPPS